MDNLFSLDEFLQRNGELLDSNLFSLDEFLQRNGELLDSNIWMVLVVDINDLESTVADLQDTIEIFSECSTVTISGESKARNLIEKISEASEEYFLLWRLES